MGGMRNVYDIVEGKKTLGRPRCRWEEILKWI
jgi:hypothetical protein